MVTILWSSSYVLIKLGLQEIPPLYFATLRYSLAFLILLVADLAVGQRKANVARPGKKQIFLLVVAGIAGYTVAQGFQFVGLYFIPAITTSFLLNFNPFLVLIIGAALLGERATLTQLAGLAVALGGAYAFFGGGLAGGESTIGIVFVVVSGVGWALYVVVVRFIQKEGNLTSLRLTTVTMGLGVAGMVGLTVASGEYAPLSWNAIVTIVWLATANTALAFLLWNWALKAIPAYELTVLQDLMLVEIAIFAVVFLQEALSPLMVVGMGLVILGVVLVQSRQLARAKNPS